MGASPPSGPGGVSSRPHHGGLAGRDAHLPPTPSQCPPLPSAHCWRIRSRSSRGCGRGSPTLLPAGEKGCLFSPLLLPELIFSLEETGASWHSLTERHLYGFSFSGRPIYGSVCLKTFVLVFLCLKNFGWVFAPKPFACFFLYA